MRFGRISFTVELDFFLNPTYDSWPRRGETAYAISFNQPVEGAISQLARAAGLQILDHNIIYKVTDNVKEKLSAELPPLVTQRVLGEAELG